MDRGAAHGYWTGGDSVRIGLGGEEPAVQRQYSYQSRSTGHMAGAGMLQYGSWECGGRGAGGNAPGHPMHPGEDALDKRW